MVRTFTGSRPLRNEIDEQEDTQLSELGMNDFRPMPRNLFVGGAEQEQLSRTNDDERTPTGYTTQPEQFQIPTRTRQRRPRLGNSQQEQPERSTEPARTTELEERTRVLEMEMGKILARLIPDDPLIPLLNRDAQPAAVVATRNSPALSNIVVPTKPRGSGRLNNEPSSSKHSEELMRKNADLKRQLWDAIMRIQNANDAMMCKVFPTTLKSTARRWYHKLPRHSIDSYSQLAKLFSNKFVSQREIKRIATELMQCSWFLDDLLENPPKSWNEVNDRSASFILLEDFQSSKRRADDKQSKSHEKPPRREEKKKQKVNEQWGEPADFPKYANYIPLTLPRADKSKHCDYHRAYGHNTEDCQHLKDELEFLARNGKLEGYVQKPYTQQPTQAHFVQGACRGRQFNRRGQGQRTATQNQKDRKEVGYAGIRPPSGTINMISGGIHSGGQSARGRKAYAGQVMIINKNRPLKWPFEEAKWENAAIPFSPVEYKRAEGEPEVMMPHAHPFVATIHIGNHNVNKVFIDTGSSPDILYWSCFQKMQLNPSSLQKYEEPIYGFDNQPVPVEGVITLPIYVGSEPRFRMASVNFLVVKMELAFNTILGRATMCELKAVVSQLHLCMKFPTPQGVGVLKENQKMVKACYQDTFKKVELAAAPRDSSESHRPTQLGQQTMSISDIEHRPEGVEQKAEPVEPMETVETVPLNPDVSERTVKISIKLTEEERVELLKFLRVNQDVFAWTTDEMPGIPAELTVHKLSTDPTKRPVVQKRRLFGPKKQAAIDEEIKKLLPRMCIDFTNLNEACPKDPHPLPNVEKLVERAAGHERMSFLDANSGIEVNPEKVQAVQQMEPPRTVKDVQRLTGRVAALHKFIARSAERCLPFFNALREPKNFQWTDECQQAFDELKQYLASAPILSKPVERKSLYLYLGVTKEAVSLVLLRKENKHQKPTCYVSKVLQGAEQNYPLAEKATFALVYTARKLRAYFQSHQIVVYTDLPLRKILQKPELSGRLIEWSIKLSEYDLKFQPRTTIKGQAVADFLVECLSVTVGDKAPEHPVWVLYVDGAANIEGSGAGAVLVGPDGFKFKHALRFKFQTTNYAAEYEALIYGLKLASELKVQSIKIDKIPRADNQRADELSKVASSQDINPQRSTIVEVLDTPSYTDFTIECQLLSTDPFSPSWTTPLIDYLQSGELPEDPSAAKLIKRRAAHFTLLDNQLYKQAASMPLLRCLTLYEAEYAVREVHGRVCGTHIGGRTLARKLLRHGYYWPTMVEDTQSYVKKCPTYQFNADDIHMPEMLSSLSSPWPFAQWGVNLLGPFVNGKGGCTYLVVAVDYFTKWIEAKSLSTTTEKKIEEFLFNSILCRSATGETSFSLAYKAKAVIPVEVRLPSDIAGRHNDPNNEQLLRENLDLVEEVREMSRIRNMAHQSRVARFYNKRVRARQFQVGDLVLPKAGLTNAYSHMGKLALNWEVPIWLFKLSDLDPMCWQIYKVVRYHSFGTYITLESFIVNISMLLSSFKIIVNQM
ncbi:hypothetical protein SLEP1_g40029 [Rubroshorea leprosula]|uniref:Uncharacterized protein n=1 Tax=Rubroshorea leprosula TaxID=152421 RepID=A0AAV5L275_9ROSI|nr:hypothetical protein SLEP1_g40029 [Rubroshorea leprosula]